MRILSYFLLLAIVLFGLTFTILNSEPVTVHYYVGQRTLPLSLLLVFVFAIGGFIGLGVGINLLIKEKLSSYRLRQRLALTEKEVENLRAIPLQDKA
jgi:lipopolysaccharide assembly protein A